MDRAPVLIINGGQATIGQSRAMEQYVAARCGMIGSNPIEAAQINCIVENVKDIKEKWGKVILYITKFRFFLYINFHILGTISQVRMMGGFGASPEKEGAMKKWFDSELQEWFGKLERSIPDNL